MLWNLAMNSAAGMLIFGVLALGLSAALLSSSNLKGFGRVVGLGVGGFLLV